MQVGSQEWIEASLARLEQLEAERGEHEQAIEAIDDAAQLKRHTDAIERLDREIKSLYAQLEQVAGEDDAEESPRETIGDDERSAPHASPLAAAAARSVAPDGPLGRPSPSPLGATSASPFASDPAPTMAASPSAYDDDLKPAGGSGKWVLIGVLGLGAAGVGGFFLWQNMQAQKVEEKPGAEQPATVIKSSEVLEDTEEPNAAKGGDATISPTANPTGTNGGSNGGGGGGKKDKKDEKKTKPIKLNTGDDPLG